MMSNYSDSKVLVLGGGGYIGSVLIRRLLALGYPVRVFDNFLFGRDGIVNLEDPQLSVIEGDICDLRAMSAAVQGAETVILLSAIIGRRFSESSYAAFRDINFLASSAVLDAAIEHGVSRFIFASTDSVYGSQSGVIYETTTPEPVSIYSRLKLRLEERVVHAKRRSFHPTALRIATCYGYSPRMRFDLVANSLVRDAICKKKLHIESKEQSRALINVDDVASAIVSCLKAHVNLVSGEVFNVGSNSQSVSLNQMVNILKGVIPDIEVSFGDSEADLTNYHLSCSKIGKILDFVPQHNLETSIRDLAGKLRSGVFEDPYALKYQNT